MLREKRGFQIDFLADYYRRKNMLDFQIYSDKKAHFFYLFL